MNKKLMKNIKAVSPVIASLMLVLVAVGAAGAFFAWQSSWQDDMTENVSDAANELSDASGGQVLTIGGSSTVYEFTKVAAPLFEEAYPGVKVDFQSGGSGAGRAAVQNGMVDIGAASSPTNIDGVVVHQVATDAVVMIHYGMNDTGDGWDFTDGDCNTTEVIAAIQDSTNVSFYDRSSKSGTEECFCNKILDSGDQIGDGDCIITAADVTQGYAGNQDLVAAFNGFTTGMHLGFTSMGQIANLDSDVTVLKFNGEVASEDNIENYDATRPITYLTLGEPTGIAKAYLTFVMGPKMNQDIAEEAEFVPMY